MKERADKGENNIRIMEEDLQEVVFDLIENIRDDVLGDEHLFTSIDMDSKYPKVIGAPDKEAETTWEAYARLYPGNRFDERKKAFQLLSVDGGNGFSGTFGKEVRRRGTQTSLESVSRASY